MLVHSVLLANTRVSDFFFAIAITEVRYFDVELVGVAALGYVSAQIFGESFDHLLSASGAKEAKLVVCGGKGGVGKITIAAAKAVRMAASGH